MVAGTTDDEDDDSTDAGHKYQHQPADTLQRGGLARNFSDLSQKLGATLRLLEARSAADDVEQLNKAPTLEVAPPEEGTALDKGSTPSNLQLERLSEAIEANTRALDAFLAARPSTSGDTWRPLALGLAGAGLALAAMWAARPRP